MRLLGVPGENIPGYKVVVPGTGVEVVPGKKSEVREKLGGKVRKITRVRSRILMQREEIEKARAQGGA